MIYGDYECPHCKHFSLKRLATRCPLCQGTVGDGFWRPILAREAASAREAQQERLRLEKMAQEEFERTLPERKKAARREAARKSADAALRGVFYIPVGCLFGGVLGSLAGALVAWIVGQVIPDGADFLIVLSFAVGAIAGTVIALRNAREQ